VVRSKAAVLTSNGDARHPSTSNSTFGDNVKLAVAAILTSTLAFSLSDAAIKLISAKFVLWQIFVIRSAIAIPLLIAIIFLRFRSTSLEPRHFGWVALRSVTRKKMSDFVYNGWQANLKLRAKHAKQTNAIQTHYTRRDTRTHYERERRRNKETEGKRQCGRRLGI
jgi:hypothetical protein